MTKDVECTECDRKCKEAEFCECHVDMCLWCCAATKLGIVSDKEKEKETDAHENLQVSIKDRSH